MDKGLIRKQFLEKRETLAFSERMKKDERIRQRFLTLKEFQTARKVFFYASYRAEVDTFGLISSALNDTKRVALPKVFPEAREIRFFWIKDIDEVSPGYWGIPEPMTDEEAFADEAELIVVPAIAYDRRGYRIGYGGGYYDRFLKKTPGHITTVGLAYDEQLIERIPTDEWDVPVKIVITDERTLYCNGH